jgi:hypothetical protein
VGERGPAVAVPALFFWFEGRGLSAALGLFGEVSVLDVEACNSPRRSRLIVRRGRLAWMSVRPNPTLGVCPRSRPGRTTDADVLTRELSGSYAETLARDAESRTTETEAPPSGAESRMSDAESRTSDAESLPSVAETRASLAEKHASHRPTGIARA